MTRSPLILAFVGMPGAGKDTCTDFIASQYNTPVLHFGNMVYDEVKRRGLDIVTDEKAVREDMRAQEGAAVLAKRIAEKTPEMLQAGQDRLILNGLYSWSEYKYLRDEFGDALKVIAIVAPRHLRYERLLARKDARRTYTIEQIKQREIAEIENLEKGGPIAMADYFLPNDSNQQQLISHLQKLLVELAF